MCPGKQTTTYAYLESDYDEEGNEWGHLWMPPEPTEVESDEGKDTTKQGNPDWEQPKE